MTLENVVADPPVLTKGGTELFVIAAAITEPVADVEFEVYQPLGYNVSVLKVISTIAV